MLDTRTSLRCLARTWLVGAAMTTRGMQHLGLLYALEPGLEILYRSPEALRAARSRYLTHVNTHPFMAPLFTGILLSMETQIARGALPPQGMAMLSRTTATTLSALGDSFFSGSLLVFWALTTSLCLILHMESLATLWTLTLFLLLLSFRVGTFFLGLRQGLLALHWVRQMDMINWSDRLKLVNAALLAMVLWHLAINAAPVMLWGNFFWGLLCLCCGSLLVNKAHVPRLLLMGFVFGALYLTGLSPNLPAHVP